MMKKKLGVDFGENVDFVLIPLGLSAAKSMGFFFCAKSTYKNQFGRYIWEFFLFYEQIYVYAIVCKIS